MKMHKDGTRTLNDTDRAQWVNNDESLYAAWKASGSSMRSYIRQERAFVDAHINVRLNQKPAGFANQPEQRA